ncbi:hypothetical protein NQZ79_g7415 [Umbelopsis isabellina]|nr:hypothetical protein NQZ79_g7415 [Umbelopsis isabellina]
MGGVQLAPRDFIEPIDLKQDVAWDQWHDLISAEDLTEEMEQIMMNESLPTWVDSWQNNLESPSLESSIFPHTLQDLFGGEELAAGLYDEMTFYPTQDSPVLENPELTSSENSVTDDSQIVDIDAYQQDNSSDSESSDSDDDEDEQVEKANAIFGHDAVSDSEDEDRDFYQKAYASRGSETIPVASFMQRRQMEESILEKITHQLEAEKLPAILTIIGSDPDHQAHGGEVEIDLTRLDQNRLGRIMAYVDACVLEQQGGPVVQLSDFLIPVAPAPVVAEEFTPSVPKRKRRSKARSRDTDDESDEDVAYTAPRRRRPAKKRSRKQSAKDTIPGNTVITDDFTFGLGGSILDGPVSISTLSSVGVQKAGKSIKSKPAASIDPESIAVSRPKRRAAIHKRRMMEQLLAPSDDEEDDNQEVASAQNVSLVVHSEERMDMRVTEDKVIVHESITAPVAGPLASTYAQAVVSDDEEDIDIMD